MTYHGMSPNNYNQMVANQFQPDSFAVVQQVYYSLEQLKVIQRHLGTLNTLGSNVHKLEYVMPYIKDIEQISMNLKHILSVESNIPFLQEISPRITEFVGTLNDITNKLNVFDNKFHEVTGLMETNIKHLEDLYCQYEVQLHHFLEEANCSLRMTADESLQQMMAVREETVEFANQVEASANEVRKEVDYWHKQDKLISHLKASDAVTLALFTKQEKDFQTALSLIKESEKYLNDEGINRQRLNYKLKDNNVMEVLKQNNQIGLQDEVRTKMTECGNLCLD